MEHEGNEERPKERGIESIENNDMIANPEKFKTIGHYKNRVITQSGVLENEIVSVVLQSSVQQTCILQECQKHKPGGPRESLKSRSNNEDLVWWYFLRI